MLSLNPHLAALVWRVSLGHGQVFRKQGLATSLTNFVKGIAEAHGVELFVSSELVRNQGLLARRMMKSAVGVLLFASNNDANVLLPRRGTVPYLTSGYLGIWVGRGSKSRSHLSLLSPLRLPPAAMYPSLIMPL